MKPQLVTMDHAGEHNKDLKQTRARYDSTKYQQWYAANAEKKRKYARSYYEANRDERVAASKAYREKNPRNWVKSHLKRLYGMEVEQFESLVLAQNGKCAICLVTFELLKKARKPHIDHDHTTGKVRGLLCSLCNISLGHLEKKGFLSAAMAYLEINKS